MKPDLRNVLIISSDERESTCKFLARHRAFPEVIVEDRTPPEALADLLALLMRSSGWAQDAWHNLELDRAVFDVETLLKLMVSPARQRISGHHCTITKIDDLICFEPHDSEARRGDGEDEGPRTTDTSRSLGDLIVVYSVGRRCGDRRESGPNGGLLPGQPERRISERRVQDRRRFGRLEVVERRCRSLKEDLCRSGPIRSRS